MGSGLPGDAEAAIWGQGYLAVALFARGVIIGEGLGMQCCPFVMGAEQGPVS